MKAGMVLAALPILGALGCRPRPPLPIFHTSPVRPQPYMDGYETGFQAGKHAAHRRAPLPDPAQIDQKSQTAAESAGPEVNVTSSVSEQWRRGFIAGYTDGFREIATGQK